MEMLVGVAFLLPSFPPSRTQAFYTIKRKNCVYFCNRVYIYIDQNGKYTMVEINRNLLMFATLQQYGSERVTNHQQASAALVQVAPCTLEQDNNFNVQRADRFQDLKKPRYKKFALRIGIDLLMFVCSLLELKCSSTIQNGMVCCFFLLLLQSSPGY